ncbi:MAG: YlbF family regulator, partial [Halanaerobiales bacterium]
MSVYSTAHKLAREIKNSDEYSDYREIREKIMDDEKSREMLEDYQQEQMRVQSKKMSGKELTEEDKEKLENLREIIEINSDIKNYLEAEYRVSVLLNDLQEILFSDLELGIQDEDGKSGDNE